jgi:hypothetical protein
MCAWVTPNSINNSSGGSALHGASKTIDGNLSTYWSHTVSQVHWVIYDLEESMEVSGIRVYADGNDTHAPCQIYEIYVSDNLANWGSSLGSLTLGTTLQWHKTTFTAKTGRYIYLKLKTWFGSICETGRWLADFYEFAAYVKSGFSQGYIFG